MNFQGARSHLLIIASVGLFVAVAIFSASGVDAALECSYQTTETVRQPTGSRWVDEGSHCGNWVYVGYWTGGAQFINGRLVIRPWVWVNQGTYCGNWVYVGHWETVWGNVTRTVNRTQTCPAPTTNACVYSSTCGTSGTRTGTSYSCGSSGCVASTSQTACSRGTDGISCGTNMACSSGQCVPQDVSPPAVSASVSPSLVGENESIFVSLNASDISGVGIIQFHDGARWQSNLCFGRSSCSWQFSISKSQPGTYVFYYSATDTKSNSTGSRLAGTVTVGDAVPPTVSASVLPNPAKTKQIISMTVTAQDLSGVSALWLYDGSAWFTPLCFGSTPCSRTHEFKKQQPGTYTLQYFATDTRRNASATRSLSLVVKQALLNVDVSSNKTQVQPGETTQLQWQVTQ